MNLMFLALQKSSPVIVRQPEGFEAKMIERGTVYHLFKNIDRINEWPLE